MKIWQIKLALHWHAIKLQYVRLERGWNDLYSTSLIKDDGATIEKAIGGWGNNKQPLRIDYIFANHRVQAKSSHVVLNGTNGPIVSDHYGVAVEI
ncbi:Maltose 6'-phosphate phosphatase [compost metagenome]